MEQNTNWLDLIAKASGGLAAAFIAVKEVRNRRFRNGHSRRQNDSEFQKSIKESLDKIETGRVQFKADVMGKLEELKDSIHTLDTRTSVLETDMKHVIRHVEK